LLLRSKDDARFRSSPLWASLRESGTDKEWIEALIKDFASWIVERSETIDPLIESLQLAAATSPSIRVGRYPFEQAPSSLSDNSVSIELVSPNLAAVLTAGRLVTLGLDIQLGVSGGRIVQSLLEQRGRRWSIDALSAESGVAFERVLMVVEVLLTNGVLRVSSEAPSTFADLLI
jgi:hypothetical protein